MNKFVAVLFFVFEAACAAENTETSQQELISKIENYFNTKLNSLESDFVQEDSHGNISRGKLFIKRKKGLMKLIYDPPNPNVIIVKDSKLTHYDRELQEKTVLSVHSSPLAFFLNKKLDLKNNIKILAVIDKKDILAVKFGKSDEEAVGAVMVIFSKEPFGILRWIVFEKKEDSNGRCTEVILRDPKTNTSFSDKVFETFS